jgi:hypothetical protein
MQPRLKVVLTIYCNLIFHIIYSHAFVQLRPFFSTIHLIMTPERVESAHVKYISLKYSILLLSGIILKRLNVDEKFIFRTVEKSLKIIKKCEADIQFLQC